MKALCLPLPAGYLLLPAGHLPLLPPGSINDHAEPYPSPLTKNSSKRESRIVLALSPAPPSRAPIRLHGNLDEVFAQEDPNFIQLDLEDGVRNDHPLYQVSCCAIRNPFRLTQLDSTSFLLCLIWISLSKEKVLVCTPRLVKSCIFSLNLALGNLPKL